MTECCVLKEPLYGIDNRVFFDPATKTLRAFCNFAYADRSKIDCVKYQNKVKTLFQGLRAIIVFDTGSWEHNFCLRLWEKMGYMEDTPLKANKDRARHTLISAMQSKGFAQGGSSGLYTGARRIPAMVRGTGPRGRFAKN